MFRKLDKRFVMIEQRGNAVSRRTVSPCRLDLAIFEPLMQVTDARTISTDPLECLYMFAKPRTFSERTGESDALHKWCVSQCPVFSWHPISVLSTEEIAFSVRYTKRHLTWSLSFAEDLLFFPSLV